MVASGTELHGVGEAIRFKPCVFYFGSEFCPEAMPKLTKKHLIASNVQIATNAVLIEGVLGLTFATKSPSVGKTRSATSP